MSVSKMVGNKRGRAYQCLRCLHKSGKEFVDARYRVENHILKQHLGLDEVPHYCSLCLFRCLKRSDLDDHIRHYKRHSLLAAEKGVTDHASCLISNPSPHVLGERDILTLTQEESALHWAGRTKRGDCLADAVSQVFPDGILADLEATTPPTAQDQTTAVGSRRPSSHPETAPDRQRAESTNSIQPQLMAEVSKLVGGTVLQTLLGLTGLGQPITKAAEETELRPAVTPTASREATPAPTPVARHTPVPAATPTPAVIQAPASVTRPTSIPAAMQTPRPAPLQADVPPQPVRAEQPSASTMVQSSSGPTEVTVGITAPSSRCSTPMHLLPELLPEEDTGFQTPTPASPKRAASRSLHRSPELKRPRTKSPARDDMAVALAKLHEQVANSTRRITDGMEANTRAIRQMEKSMNILARATERLAGAMEREERRRQREEARQEEADRRRHSQQVRRRSPEPSTTMRSVVGVPKKIRR